ncbi:YciI family protein [Streptomyces sp. NBC_00876]|uniref:YciI family protein n=1 Tax=Streptomyces sp. NBC_00876 TaxID=2975853 RepID=UPI00386B2650|nr:YciI family protein [Streptomyces sp. NBC_00876]
MKHYLLSVVTPTDGVPPSPGELEAIMRDVEGFHRELRQAGAWVFDGGLSAPDTATVVRAKDGGTMLTDGPYAEGKEYLGGLSIVKAPDLDAALDWGRKAALAIGLPIEVRPFEGEVEG